MRSTPPGASRQNPSSQILRVGESSEHVDLELLDSAKEESCERGDWLLSESFMRALTQTRAPDISDSNPHLFEEVYEIEISPTIRVTPSPPGALSQPQNDQN